MPRSVTLRSLGEDSLQSTIAARWQRQCENLFAPIFFEMWETGDAKDDETLATVEEYSFEDESNVNVRVAVQVGRRHVLLKVFWQAPNPFLVL